MAKDSTVNSATQVNVYQPPPRQVLAVTIAGFVADEGRSKVWHDITYTNSSETILAGTITHFVGDKNRGKVWVGITHARVLNIFT